MRYDVVSEKNSKYPIFFEYLIFLGEKYSLTTETLSFELSVEEID